MCKKVTINNNPCPLRRPLLGPYFGIGGVLQNFHEHVFFEFRVALGETNIAMENGPFEDVFPIKHGDIPLLC